MNFQGYRGKDLESDVWRFGSLVYLQPRGAYIVSFKAAKDTEQSYPVKSYTVGQYTGYKDRKATKVYFGDLVTNSVFIAEIIRHDNGGIGLKMKSGAISFIDARSIRYLKVIGDAFTKKCEKIETPLKNNYSAQGANKAIPAAVKMNETICKP